MDLYQLTCTVFNSCYVSGRIKTEFEHHIALQFCDAKYKEGELLSLDKIRSMSLLELYYFVVRISTLSSSMKLHTKGWGGGYHTNLGLKHLLKMFTKVLEKEDLILNTDDLVKEVTQLKLENAKLKESLRVLL